MCSKCKLMYNVSRFLNHGMLSWGSLMYALSHCGVTMGFPTIRLPESAIHGVTRVLMSCGWNGRVMISLRLVGYNRHLSWLTFQPLVNTFEASPSTFK